MNGTRGRSGKNKTKLKQLTCEDGEISEIPIKRTRGVRSSSPETVASKQTCSKQQGKREKVHAEIVSEKVVTPKGGNPKREIPHKQNKGDTRKILVKQLPNDANNSATVIPIALETQADPEEVEKFLADGIEVTINQEIANTDEDLILSGEEIVPQQMQLEDGEIAEEGRPASSNDGEVFFNFRNPERQNA